MLNLIAGHIRRDRDSLVERVVDDLIGQIPTYATLSRSSRQELSRNIRDLIDLVISFLEAGGEDSDETYAYARKVSQARFVQSIPFGDLVRSYYVGEAVIWGAVVQAVAEGDFPLEDWSRLFEIKSELESHLISGLSFAYMDEKNRYVTRRLQELTAMIEVGRTIAATINLDQVLRQILEVSTAVMQVHMGGVFLMDEDTGNLRLEASLGLQRPWGKGMVMDLSRSLLREAFASGRPEAAVDDGLAGLQLPALPGGRKVRSLISCPILKADSRIGGIELYDEEPRVYQALDLALLDTFASQAAVAIQNARLFELEKRRREQALIAKEMAEDVARSVNYYQALGIVVHNLTSIAGVDRCTLYSYDRETGEMEFLRGFGLKAAERKALKGLRVRAAEVDEMTRRAVEVGEMVSVEDASSDPRVNPRNARVFGLRSCLLVPLKYRDQVTGLVCLDHTRKPHRSPSTATSWT